MILYIFIFIMCSARISRLLLRGSHKSKFNCENRTIFSRIGTKTKNNSVLVLIVWVSDDSRQVVDYVDEYEHEYDEEQLLFV